MREIKFRQAIFHPATGKFLKWHYWGLIDGAFVGVDTGWVSPTKAIENSQMFTTLLDKDSKELYGGDILKTEANNIGVVEWWGNHFGMGFTIVEGGLAVDYDDEWDAFEVIGNICENKELLNELPQV